ncbi:MAG: 16S rRNA processing protein RimM [Gemmatimonadetes bacterium]|nr:16S rRNA processing protein RimM [Gemmatimonadota bacterium]
MSGVEYLGVARFHKPHGLNGEALVFALTSEPDAVFTEGRELTPLDDAGNPAETVVIIERARRYHREWLIKFRGVDDRSTLDQWSRQALLGVPRADLTPPRENQLYKHEIPGTSVVVGGKVVGVALEVVSGPAGDLLSLDVGGKELLVPFRKPIVKRIDREARQIELDPPPGLLDL